MLRSLLIKPIWCLHFLYYWIKQVLQKKSKRSEILLSDDLLAYTDGKHVHLSHTSPSAQDRNILAVSARSASGCKHRAWCNALRSALNDTVYRFDVATLGVDYVKIHHKTGVKLFISNDKDIPTQILSQCLQ